MTRFRAACLACLLTACTSSRDKPALPAGSAAAPPASASPSPASPSVAPAVAPAAKAAPPVAAASADAGSDLPGTHLDDDALPKAPAHPSPAPRPPVHPIGITLRTTPSGARVTIDGEPVGVTPTFWAGDADGHTHTFAFVLDGRGSNGQRYAVSYYEFVPVTSGIIHVKLEPLAAAAPD